MHGYKKVFIARDSYPEGPRECSARNAFMGSIVVTRKEEVERGTTVYGPGEWFTSYDDAEDVMPLSVDEALATLAKHHEQTAERFRNHTEWYNGRRADLLRLKDDPSFREELICRRLAAEYERAESLAIADARKKGLSHAPKPLPPRLEKWLAAKGFKTPAQIAEDRANLKMAHRASHAAELNQDAPKAGEADDTSFMDI